jgi:dihydrofolate reductase
MRKLVLLTFVSLDGVMQAPGGKGEDPSGGFDLEGWTVPYFDEAVGQAMSDQMRPPFDLLLGRKTYEIFAGYWPHQSDEDPGAAALNRATKYVVSHHPIDLAWEGSILITGNVPTEIAKLKGQEGPTLQVHGSSDMIQTLLAEDLVDELWLKVFPVTLGKGKRLFGGGTMPGAFKLIDSMASDSGVVISAYRRDGDVRLGTFTPAAE